MIAITELVSTLNYNGVNFATGVPDSLLGQLGAALDNPHSGIKHVTAVNEGSAVGLGIGSYLATGRLPLVYMQNSGLGNALNPLVSLAGSSTFNVPLLLLIGWRGEVGPEGAQIEDEPQHILQGRITPALLELMEIPFFILDSKSSIYEVVASACKAALQRSLPVAIVVRKGSFQSSAFLRSKNAGNISRRRSIEVICDSIPTQTPIIATTGMISRELFDVRRLSGQNPPDLLCVGGMGHAVSVASGFASMSSQRILLLDGDGSAQMHLGALLTASSIPNLIHVVLNNGGHASVGGQSTSSPDLDFSLLTPYLGYKNSFRANNEVELRDSVAMILARDTSSFLEIRCAMQTTPELGRPEDPPSINASLFSQNVTPPLVKRSRELRPHHAP